MHGHLLDGLVCPICHGGLRWTIGEAIGGRIETAEAFCAACPASYPVKEGIALFLTPGLARHDMWEELDSQLSNHLRQYPEVERRLMECDPHRWQRSQGLEDRQPLRIEPIRLMHVPHHILCHLGVSEEGNASGLFDLIDDPVPVAIGFEGDRRCFWEPREKGPVGGGLVFDPGLLDGPASMIENGEERRVLVCVTTDFIMEWLRHAASSCALAGSQLPV